MNLSFLNKRVLNAIIFVVSALIIYTLSSCKKDNTSDDTGINDNYYVKYQIKGNGAYGYFSDWTVTTPQGNYSNNGYQTKTWSQTFGPVKKGFRCEVKISNYIGGAPTIEIYASKNQEPFALKVTSVGSSASYTVNF